MNSLNIYYRFCSLPAKMFIHYSPLNCLLCLSTGIFIHLNEGVNSISLTWIEVPLSTMNKVWEINPGVRTEGFGPIPIKYEEIILSQGRRIIFYCLLMNSVMTALHSTLDSSKWLLYLRSQIYFAHVRHYFHSWSSRTLHSESKMFHQTM